jgi:hypothetical protein
MRLTLGAQGVRKFRIFRNRTLKEITVLSGIRIERSEHGEPGEFERMSDEELRENLTERARALGFEPPPETQH